MSEDKATRKSKIEQFKESAENDPDFKGFTKKKKHMLYALKLQKGNVTATATMLGISRRHIYTCCEEDPKFKEAFTDIKEMKLDFVENKLMQRIEEGSDMLIMYVLNCQGGDRGWVNSNKVDHTTNGKDLPAAQPMMFLSADQMTPEQLQAYIKQNTQSADSNDTGS